MSDRDLYDAAHRAARAQWERVIARLGQVRCHSPWCKQPNVPIRAGDPWDLGHNHGRRGWRGPEHPGCNRATRSHQAALRKRPNERHPGTIGDGT